MMEELECKRLKMTVNELRGFRRNVGEGGVGYMQWGRCWIDLSSSLDPLICTNTCTYRPHGYGQGVILV